MFLLTCRGVSESQVSHEYQKKRSVLLHAYGYHEYGYDDQSSDELRLVLCPRFYNDPMRNADLSKIAEKTTFLFFR